ncbi:MAG: ACP phosphodiesterase [Pseudomonadales bacterium]
MNFLAHCLIGASAGGTDEGATLLAGGFLGDFIKGRIPNHMPEPLARGVRLHRRVDAYSGRQPEIRLSCDRFPPELRRIAPILVDIIADHLLARHWSTFHPEPLDAFTAGTYRQVATHRTWLTEPGNRFFDYAREHDLLAAYQDWAVICGAMRSITRRLCKSELDAIMETTALALLDDLEGDFLTYFPDVIDHASQWVLSQS